MAGKVKPPTSSVVITANRLVDGHVVWLTPQGCWAEDVGDAMLFAPMDAAAAIAAGLRDEQRQIIVASYAAEADATEQGPMPSRYRERIRAFGPSIPLKPATAPSTA